MKSRNTQPRETMNVLLERGRVVPPIPDSIRARALARARSTIGSVAKEEPRRAPVARHRGLAIALAASVAFAGGAAAATVAFRSRVPQRPPATSPTPPQTVQSSCATSTPLPPSSSSVAPQTNQEPKPQRPERSISAQESYAIELGILQRAQAAYATQNFATTLLLVTEHSRRFPNGRLAEEREALRVKGLIGAGREKEANQAASAFETRFPRSPLLR
jgi:hypothetical protein